MIDLSTNYLGLKLKNPVVVSASPLTEKLENFARLEDAGASAIVMYSLMEEQIEAESENIDNALEYGTNSYAESTSYLPDMQKYHIGPDRYLELLRKGKASVSIPVIASLNGRSPGGWVRYSEYMELAGADAREQVFHHAEAQHQISGAVVWQAATPESGVRCGSSGSGSVHV